jgi:hypothetical protein
MRTVAVTIGYAGAVAAVATAVAIGFADLRKASEKQQREANAAIERIIAAGRQERMERRLAAVVHTDPQPTDATASASADDVAEAAARADAAETDADSGKPASLAARRAEAKRGALKASARRSGRASNQDRFLPTALVALPKFAATKLLGIR